MQTYKKADEEMMHGGHDSGQSMSTQPYKAVVQIVPCTKESFDQL